MHKNNRGYEIEVEIIPQVLGSGCGSVGRAVAPTPEVRGSLRVIRKFSSYVQSTVLAHF